MLIANARLIDQPIVYVSENFAKMVGLSRAELMHRPATLQFLCGMHTDPIACERLRDALNNRTPDQFELLLYKCSSAFTISTALHSQFPFTVN